MKKLTLLTLLTLLSAFLGLAQDATAPAKVKKPAVTNSSSETVTGEDRLYWPQKNHCESKGCRSLDSFLDRSRDEDHSEW